MKKKYLLGISIMAFMGVLCGNSASAATVNQTSGDDDIGFSILGTTLRPFITVEGGAAIAQVDQPQTYVSGGGTTYSYMPNNNSEVKGMYGALIGVEFPIIRQDGIHMQAGVAFNQTLPFQSQGLNTVDNDLYNYSYNISSQQILGEVKLLFTFAHRYHPYLSGAVGAAFNKAYAYQGTLATPDGSPNVDPFYPNHNSTNVAFGGGAGIDVDITQNIRLGIAYQFMDLGSANLGQGVQPVNGSSIAYTLKQDHVYVNEITGQLTFIL